MKINSLQWTLSHFRTLVSKKGPIILNEKKQKIHTKNQESLWHCTFSNNTGIGAVSSKFWGKLFQPRILLCQSSGRISHFRCAWRWKVLLLRALSQETTRRCVPPNLKEQTKESKKISIALVIEPATEKGEENSQGGVKQNLRIPTSPENHEPVQMKGLQERIPDCN